MESPSTEQRPTQLLNVEVTQCHIAVSTFENESSLDGWENGSLFVELVHCCGCCCFCCDRLSYYTAVVPSACTLGALFCRLL